MREATVPQTYEQHHEQVVRMTLHTGHLELYACQLVGVRIVWWNYAHARGTRRQVVLAPATLGR